MKTPFTRATVLIAALLLSIGAAHGATQVWACGPVGALTTAETSGALATLPVAATVAIDISPTNLGAAGGGSCLIPASTPNTYFVRTIVNSGTPTWVTLASLGLGTGVVAPPAATGSALLSWAAPTANTDGSSPVTPLASYNIYQGPNATSLAKSANVLAPVTKYIASALLPGTYFFAVTAVGVNGTESAESAVASDTITVVQPAKVPGQPTSLTITSTVTATAP